MLYRELKFSFYFLCLILLSACSIHAPENKMTTIGMFTPHVLFPIKYHGQIKKVSEKIYLAKEVNGTVIFDRPLTIADRNVISWSNDFEVHFTSEGLVKQCTILDDQGHILQSYRNHIKNGKVVKFDIVEKDTLSKSLNFLYDVKGFIDKIKSYAYPGNIFLGTEDFATDENGNITYIDFFDVSGKPETNFEMFLDSSGRRTGYKQCDANGRKISGADIVYNENGFIETKTEVNGKGKVSIAKYEYKYDKKGNWIQCIVSTNNLQLMIVRKYEYWTKG